MITIQYGKSHGSTTSRDVVFPITYSSIPTVCISGNYGGNTDYIVHNVRNLIKTKFNLYVAVASLQISWISIGY